MEHLWAPWRMKYIEIAKQGPDKGCFLCQRPDECNADGLVLYHGKYNFIIMNRYPYNGGHLMVAPNRHTANLEELTEDELLEHYQLVQQAIKALKETFHPEGFNVGMNLGRIAGAGVDKHIHTHIVPRWAGDTNFMPVIGDTNVVNEALQDTYKKLADRFS
jgi:ATP adenylyltransferase